jgi:hypothetical protein
MKPNETEIAELQKLEREAADLLTGIARLAKPVSDETLEQLEIVAGAAAKIAYGTGNPKLLSEQMSTLITWTDHLDNVSLVEKFHKALASQPLIHPWK